MRGIRFVVISLLCSLRISASGSVHEGAGAFGDSSVQKKKSLLCFDVVRFNVANTKAHHCSQCLDTQKYRQGGKHIFWLICEASTCLTANTKQWGGNILSLNISFLPTRHPKPETQLPTSPRLRLLGTKPLLLSDSEQFPTTISDMHKKRRWSPVNQHLPPSVVIDGLCLWKHCHSQSSPSRCYFALTEDILSILNFSMLIRR